MTSILIAGAGDIAKAATPIPTSKMHHRPADQRGGGDHGWLKSRFSFSFADYQDPDNVHFNALRVINDDVIAPASGFPMHPHKNFEIFSYVLDGAIAHKDSMGNGSTVHGGGVQYMSAGSGVRHSEFNPSSDEPLRLLQIWLIPNQTGGTPLYETLDIDTSEKAGRLKLFLSNDGREGSIRARTDSDIYAATLTGDETVSFSVRPKRQAWVQVARGSLDINGLTLQEGDGLAVEASGLLTFSKGQSAEFLLFDLSVME